MCLVKSVFPSNGGGGEVRSLLCGRDGMDEHEGEEGVEEEGWSALCYRDIGTRDAPGCGVPFGRLRRIKSHSGMAWTLDSHSTRCDWLKFYASYLTTPYAV